MTPELLDELINLILFGEIRKAPWDLVPEIQSDTIDPGDIEAVTRTAIAATLRQRYL